jgi:hypothetical protein
MVRSVAEEDDAVSGFTPYPWNEGLLVVAIGTWMYDGTVPMEIKLLSRPVTDASSRYVTSEENGGIGFDDTKPIPVTADGYVYYVGATSGGEFLSIEDAIAWADKQAWGPVAWTFLKTAD